MSTPYETPATNPEGSNPSELNPKRTLVILGVALLSCPLIGKAISFAFIMRTFSHLEGQDSPPAMLANDIQSALISFLIVLGLGLIGTILVSIALHKNSNREPWFFYTTMILSLLISIFCFPIGLLFGLFLAISFFIKRKEFRSQLQMS